MQLTMARRPLPPPDQRGASLLEVLIAVLILGVGMLGMAALQSVTLKNSNSSSGRSQAVIHTYSMLDSLRLVRDQASTGAFNVASWSCAARTAATGDSTDYSIFNGWLADVQKSLGDPNACGRVNCNAETCTVGIRWDDSRPTAQAADKQLTIETTSRL